MGAPPESRDDYFIGTTDAEIDRLYRQHIVWRSRAADAWRRAGFARGNHLVDLGCGPGHASIDLAAVVGREGRITAIDRSARFLERLNARAAALDIATITTHVADLDADPLPDLTADGVWCRWVLGFLRKPREILDALHKRVRPGGALVLHEYFDYGSWRLAPASSSMDEFVQSIIRNWRADGGEPDVALDLLRWLPAAGFEIRELHPIIDVITPNDASWEWLDSFVHAGIRRLTALGVLTEAAAETMAAEYRIAASVPNVRMVTPGVLEIIAIRTADVPLFQDAHSR